MATGPLARGKQSMTQEDSNGMQLLNFEFAVAGWFQISMSSIFAPTSNLLQQAHGQDVRGGLWVFFRPKMVAMTGDTIEKLYGFV